MTPCAGCGGFPEMLNNTPEGVLCPSCHRKLVLAAKRLGGVRLYDVEIDGCKVTLTEHEARYYEAQTPLPPTSLDNIEIQRYREQLNAYQNAQLSKLYSQPSNVSASDQYANLQKLIFPSPKAKP